MPSEGQIRTYFSNLITTLGGKADVDLVVVAHMVPNTLGFAPALNSLGHLAGILVKPKTEGRPEFNVLKSEFRMLKFSRDWADDPAQVVDMLSNLGLRTKNLVLLDIGGYFANSIDLIAEGLGAQLLGVMEGGGISETY